MKAKNTLSLTPEMVAELGLECEVGKEETVTLTITPTSVDNGLTAEVTAGGYEEPDAEEAPAPPVKGKRPPAMEAALGA